MQATNKEHERPISTPNSEQPRSFFARNSASHARDHQDEDSEEEGAPTKWSMGVLNDRHTHEVPGMYPYTTLSSDDKTHANLKMLQARFYY